MNAVPEILKAKRQWLVWKYQQVAHGKPRKVPYYINGCRRRGQQGSAADVKHLGTFEEAQAACNAQKMSGVGFALLNDCGITALDFDHCVDATGQVNPEVERLITGTYAELSPSKNGVRAFFIGDLGNHKDFKGEYGFEVFSSTGFVTVTGDALPWAELMGAEVIKVTKEVKAYCQQRFSNTSEVVTDPLLILEPAIGLTTQQIEDILTVLDPTMTYPEWVNVGMALHHETEGEGFEFWNAWSADAGNYPGTEALQEHWDSFGRNRKPPITARYLLRLAKKEGLSINPDVASESEFDEVTDEKDDSGSPRFEVVDGVNFADGEPTPWLIKGVLPWAELGVIFGESGSGKSFFVSDMALSLARGESWRGLKTRQCRVVYVAAEGGSGFRKRLKAYEQHHNISLAGVAFGVIHIAPNFLQKMDALAVAKSIKAWGGADLIIIDTFAQVTPGANENAGEDVGKAITHFKGLHRALGAMVLLIHHSGKDTSKGARGWSGLRAAADVEIEVIRTETGRAAKVTKQKDGNDQGEWGFNLQVVPIGMDEDGDVIDSCVVVEAQIPTRAGGRATVGKWQKVVIEVISEFAISQNAGIEVEAIIEECLRRTEAPEGKRDNRRRRIREAIRTLCEGDESLYLEEDGCLEVM